MNKSTQPQLAPEFTPAAIIRKILELKAQGAPKQQIQQLQQALDGAKPSK